MNEASGVLQPAVRRYLTGKRMSHGDVALVRAYLRMWIDAPWDSPLLDALRTQVDEIVTSDDIDRWIDRASRDGIDPF